MADLPETQLTESRAFNVNVGGFTTFFTIVLPDPARFYLRVGADSTAPYFVSFSSAIQSVANSGFRMPNGSGLTIEWKRKDVGDLVTGQLFGMKMAGATLNIQVEECRYVYARRENREPSREFNPTNRREWNERFRRFFIKRQNDTRLGSP